MKFSISEQFTVAVVATILEIYSSKQTVLFRLFVGGATIYLILILISVW